MFTNPFNHKTMTIKHIMFILTILCFFSCKDDTTQKESSKDYMIIRGEIKNPSGDDILIGFGNKNIVELNNGFFIDTLKFKKNVLEPIGLMFFDRVNMDFEKVLYLYYKEGSELVINVDMNNFKETLELEGSGKQYIDFLNKYDEIQENIPTNLSEDMFLNKLENYATKVQSFLNTHNSLDAKLVNLKRESLENETIGNLINYIASNSKKENSLIWKKLNAFNFGDILKYKNYTYSRNANLYHQLLLEKKKKEYPAQKEYRLFSEILKSKTYSNEMKAKFAKKYFSVYFNYRADFEFIDKPINELSEIKNIYDSFLLNTDDKQKLNHNFEAVSKLTPGKYAPNFKLLDINEKPYTLQQFRGKNVIIDVWATWCGPCIRDFKPLKDLINKHKNKNIQLIKVAHDKKEKVKKYLEKKKTKNIELIADENFLKNYAVSTVPRYIIIDKEGKIITVHSSGPNSEEMQRILNNL